MLKRDSESGNIVRQIIRNQDQQKGDATMQEINAHQRTLYEKYDFEGSRRYLDKYCKHLACFTHRKALKILDIGGASGYFAWILKEHFQNAQVEVYVLDSSQYDSWAEDALGKDIHFICASVENISTLFRENTFDIIFANRVFHHFIDKSWKKSLQGMEASLVAISKILKEDGMLCIMDHFYNGIVVDPAASFIIYSLTSVKNSFFARIIKKLGAMTAGVGVCFLSEKMWMKKVTSAGFEILNVERSACDKLKFLKKVALLCKSVSRNNIICAKPIK